MKYLESGIKFLQFEMETPKMYVWFHILSIILVILLTIYLIKFKKDDRKVLFVLSLIMIIFEIYKQLSFSYDDSVWEYEWYAFPFQFCSTPMYVAFLASLAKSEKLKNTLYSFLATYGLVAGISVMLYPSTVFISEVLIDIQTMIHHGFMVVMGVYLIATNKVNISLKTIINALKVFLVFVFIALIANIITYYVNLDSGLELFYISPFHEPVLPVFDIIYNKVPYVIFLLTYIITFTVGSSIPIGIAKLLKKGKNHELSGNK